MPAAPGAAAADPYTSRPGAARVTGRHPSETENALALGPLARIHRRRTVRAARRFLRLPLVHGEAARRPAAGAVVDRVRRQGPGDRNLHAERAARTGEARSG